MQSLQKVLETWKAPGFAVAVIEKDKIVYAKGFGYSDYENKVAVTPHTLFLPLARAARPLLRLCLVC
jgi:CubicO group peptidase (beta-lactamase class C family)